jgi:site-specific recombinase XerD
MTKPDAPSLDERIAEYLNHLFESPRTLQTYTSGLEVFARFLADGTNGASRVPSPRVKNKSGASTSPRRGKQIQSTALGAPKSLAMETINTNVLQDFQTWLGQKNYSRFSQRTYLASVNAFLSYALSQDWLPDSFSLEKARAKLKHVTRRSAYPIPRPDPALPRLIAYFDDLPLPDANEPKGKIRRLQILRDRAFLHLLYSSAGRLSEVAALNRKDVADGRRKEAIVRGKGDKERFIFITPEARAAISRYIAERHDTFEPLFISHGRKYGSRFTKMSLWRTVSRAAKKLGMDVSPHDFRHFRARQMLEQGAPLEAIQEILGHSDIGTTRRVYAHYSKPSIRTIFERTTLTPDDAARILNEHDGESAN